ncbi:MAG: TraB/GumN family protein [Arenimonas sp.]
MRLIFSLALLLGLQSYPVFSQSTATEEEIIEDATPLPDGVKVLDVMVVSGAQPGPGMWKVSKGDNIMWIMGVQSPLPKKMEWVSRDVEKKIAQSDEVLFLLV